MRGCACWPVRINEGMMDDWICVAYRNMNIAGVGMRACSCACWRGRAALYACICAHGTECVYSIYVHLYIYNIYNIYILYISIYIYISIYLYICICTYVYMYVAGVCWCTKSPWADGGGSLVHTGEVLRCT
jgi:hypothetical protein